MIGKFLHREITIWMTNDRDAYGKSNSVESLTLKARVQPYTKNIIGYDGNKVMSAFSVFFEATHPIPHRCDIEVKPQSKYEIGVRTPAIRVNNYYDDMNKYRYTRVIC